MKNEDLAQVVAIERLSFAAPKDEAVFRHDEIKYLVANENDKVVGYIGFEKIAGEIHIINMAVHPDHRGKGIGKKLMEEALISKEVVFLEVRVSNLPAQKIYEHFGFKKVGMRKGYYQDNGEDAILMRREPKGQVTND
ncbi:MAG: ribosomal protein S18-alanine N-acetyltransferase [Candidatus Margulisiibacteriota bacterium]